METCGIPSGGIQKRPMRNKKRRTSRLGTAFVLAGTALLVVCHLTSLNSSNTALLGSIAAILIGIALHIAAMKIGERY